MVVPTFPIRSGEWAGGVAGAAVYLCNALNKSAEIDLHVIRPMAPLGSPGVVDVDGVRVYPLKKPVWQPPFYNLLFGVRRQVAALVRTIRPDVVHDQAHGYYEARHLPRVVTMHGVVEIDSWHRASRWTRWLRYQILHQIEGRARRRWSNVIAISPYSRQFLGPEGSQRVWDIPNPVADSYFDIVRRPEPGRVLAVGYIQRLKNTAGLIRAFAVACKAVPQGRLRLAGSEPEPEYATECRDLARDLGVADRVDFLGLLTVPQIQRELAAASVLASCSLQENAPLSIAEAMAAGVPVVATKVGGVPWMVDDGMTGLLVDTGVDIAGELMEIMQLGVNERLGTAAKAKAEQYYRPSRVAELTIAVYRDLAERAKRGSR